MFPFVSNNFFNFSRSTLLSIHKREILLAVSVAAIAALAFFYHSHHSRVVPPDLKPKSRVVPPDLKPKKDRLDEVTIDEINALYLKNGIQIQTTENSYSAKYRSLSFLYKKTHDFFDEWVHKNEGARHASLTKSIKESLRKRPKHKHIFVTLGINHLLFLPFKYLINKKIKFFLSSRDVSERQSNCAINNARIIFLAENHLNRVHRLANSKIINDLYQEGDLVLVEDSRPCRRQGQLEYITKGVQVKSWDIDKPSDPEFAKNTLIFKGLYRLLRGGGEKNISISEGIAVVRGFLADRSEKAAENNLNN